jgi:predicted RNase H-related nuclease YkuK (DUF458 family)
MKKIDEQELRDFMINMSPETKIYFGADSERFKQNGRWFAKIVTVIVVHIEGCKGCKIFAESTTIPDIDKDSSKPFQRMMAEASAVADLHARFKDVFYDFEVSIHLDVNPRKTAGSSVAKEAAVGYIKAMTQVTPELKPLAFAASYAADRSVDLGICK